MHLLLEELASLHWSLSCIRSQAILHISANRLVARIFLQVANLCLRQEHCGVLPVQILHSKDGLHLWQYM